MLRLSLKRRQKTSATYGFSPKFRKGGTWKLAIRSLHYNTSTTFTNLNRLQLGTACCHYQQEGTCIAYL